MQQFYELARDQRMEAQVWHAVDNQSIAHFHSAVELILVEEGSLVAMQEGRSRVACAGEIIVNSSYTIHGYTTPAHAQTIVATIPLATVPSLQTALSQKRFAADIVRAEDAAECARLLQLAANPVHEQNQNYINGLNLAVLALLMEKVGLKDRAHHLPGQLSGGEQQRVCVARALINDPKLILADEPTGNLDEKNEKIVLDLFRKLHEQGTTIIVVTHDALVASCAQREIMLNHGVLVGEKWNDEDARKAYEAAGGKPASTGAQVEGAQNGETAIGFTDPTKAAKTGGEE